MYTSTVRNIVGVTVSKLSAPEQSRFKRSICTRAVGSTASLFGLFDALANTFQGVKYSLKDLFGRLKHRSPSGEKPMPYFKHALQDGRGVFTSSFKGIIKPEMLAVKPVDDRVFDRMEPKPAAAFYKIMQVEKEIFEKHNIRWWICSGTLLGDQRHGGIIPWDDDADTQIHPDDQHKLELPEVQQDFEKHGLRLVKHWLVGYKIVPITCPEYGMEMADLDDPSHSYVWPNVDIFLSERNKDGKITFTGKAKEFWPKEAMSEKELFDDQGKLREVKYGPVTLLAPQKPKPYLFRLYGADCLKKAYRIWDHQNQTFFDGNKRQRVNVITKTPAEYDKTVFENDFNE